MNFTLNISVYLFFLILVWRRNFGWSNFTDIIFKSLIFFRIFSILKFKLVLHGKNRIFMDNFLVFEYDLIFKLSLKFDSFD
jgi:hypothetical protein